MRNRSLLACFLAFPLMVACDPEGNGSPTEDGRAADGGSADSGPADGGPIQPRGGVLVPVNVPADVQLLHFRGGAEQPDVVLLSALAEGPRITSVQPVRVAPLGRMVVEGEGFRADTAATVAVLFNAQGAMPIAMPVVEATPSRLVLVAPALLDWGGASVGGPVALQVVQIGAGEAEVSAPWLGVEVGELPRFSPGLPPGEATAAYLDAAQRQVADVATTERDLPAGFVARAGDLAAALSTLKLAVDRARTDPASAVVPWQGAGPAPPLDAEALALADRLAFALLQAGHAAAEVEKAHLQADRSERRRAVARSAERGVQQAALSDCPLYEGSPEEQMKSLLCQRSAYGDTLVREGSTAIAWGAQVEIAVFTGFYGSAGSTVLGAGSRRAALAFEAIWAGLSGHIAAWATASRPPTTARTATDVGVQVVDTVARLGGTLGTLVAMLAFTAEYDQLIRGASAPPPDAGVPPPDAGPTDAGTGPFPPVLEGIFESAQDWPDECAAHLDLVVVLTIENLAGQGTDRSPYTGTVSAVGSISGGDTVAGPDCEPGRQSFPITAFNGHLAGSAGVVVIEGDLVGPEFTLTLEFPSGHWDGTTLRGPVAVYMPNPQLAPFQGELVLAAP